jgi:HEAT repeat protein
MFAALALSMILAAEPDPYALVHDTGAVRAEAVADLIRQLGTDRTRGRQAAMRLVRFGASAVPALKEALRDERLQVRFYAAAALELIRHSSACEALFETLQDDREDPRVRSIAARAMGRGEYRRAVGTLIALVRPSGPKRPAPSRAAPGAQGAGTVAVPTLDEPTYLAESPLAADEEFRFEVIRSLAYIGDNASAELLVDALRDPSARIREVAAQGAGDQRLPTALDGLRRLLGDANGNVAASSACALGKYGSAATVAVPDLIDALGVPDARVQRHVHGALAVITGYSFATPERWRGWWAARGTGEPDPAAGAPAASADDDDRPAAPASGRPPTGSVEPAAQEPPAGYTPPALRPPWEWDDRDWRTPAE